MTYGYIKQKPNNWIDRIDRKVMPFVEYPGYEDKYPTVSICKLSKDKIDELREASGKLFQIFCKASKVFQQCSDDFMEDMEIPSHLRPYLRHPNAMNLPTWLSRFDFVLDERRQKIHMVEINADTPCAVVEAFYANKIACNAYSENDPNSESYRELLDWLKKIFMRTYQPKVNLHTGNFDTEHPFLFSCFDDYIEDNATTKFLMDAMKEAVGSMYPPNMIVFESFYNLKVTYDGKIELPDGRTAEAIYRLHPMELLAEERADDGSSLGEAFLDGYINGQFQMFNPPEAIIMQSKGFQALVWALAHRHENIFTLDEISTIKEYMLPSFFEDDFNQTKKSSEEEWIRKPIWGREGNGISVIKEDNTILEKEVPYPEDIVQKDSSSYLYQQFVRQMQTKAETSSGTYDGYLTISCFMLGDAPSAVYCRFSPEQVAGTEAYWLPLCLEEGI